MNEYGHVPIKIDFKKRGEEGMSERRWIRKLLIFFLPQKHWVNKYRPENLFKSYRDIQEEFQQISCVWQTCLYLPPNSMVQNNLDKVP